MTFEFVSVDKSVATKLKELGFDEPCIARFYKGNYCMNMLGNLYNHNSGEISKSYISAPLFTQVQQWCFKKFNKKVVCDFYPFDKDKSEKDYWRQMNTNVKAVIFDSNLQAV